MSTAFTAQAGCRESLSRAGPPPLAAPQSRNPLDDEPAPGPAPPSPPPTGRTDPGDLPPERDSDAPSDGHTHAPPGAQHGFVRLPRAWLEIPVSPQARFLLTLFCAYADDSGASYHSYTQLGATLGRSKASVAAYVRELRDHGLIAVTRQTFGNGYNYRLRIRLRDWRAMLDTWSRLAVRKHTPPAAANRREPRPAQDAAASAAADASAAPATAARHAPPTPRDPGPHGPAQPVPDPDCPHPLPSAGQAADPPPARTPASDKRAPCAQSPERRIQPGERKDPKGPSESHQNQTHRAAERRGWSTCTDSAGCPAPGSWTEADERRWRALRPDDSAPLASFRHPPPDGLADRVVAHADRLKARAGLLNRDEAHAAAHRRLADFARRKRLCTDGPALEDTATALRDMAATHPGQEAAIAALDAIWKPHWQRLPSPRQLRETARAAARDAALSFETRRETGLFMARAAAVRAWRATTAHRPGDERRRHAATAP